MSEEIIFSEAIAGNGNILEDVEQDLFSDYQLGIMYGYVKWLYHNGLKINYDAIRNKINSDDKLKNKTELLDRLQKVESSSYYFISSLLDDFKMDYKVRIIKQYSHRLLSVGNDFCTIEDAKEYIEKMQSAIEYGVSEEDIIDNSLLDEKLFKSENGIKRIPLTDDILKDSFGACLLSRMYVISGFPSMGKNIILDNLVINLAKNGIAGVYFSFDNSAVETRASLYSIECVIPYRMIEERNIDDYYLTKIRNAKFRDYVHVVERKKTSKQIRRILQIAKKRYNIHWFCLDYFQNINLPGSKDVVRHFEQAAIDLKTVCTELDIAGIILSQQNDQGSIKWCRGLFEEAYYLLKIDGSREENIRDLKIEKYKKGALKTIKIQYDASVGLLWRIDG